MSTWKELLDNAETDDEKKDIALQYAQEKAESEHRQQLARKIRDKHEKERTALKEKHTEYFEDLDSVNKAKHDAEKALAEGEYDKVNEYLDE